MRVDRRRKARFENSLRRLGITPPHAVNLLFAEIERRRAIPFPIALEDCSDLLPPIEHVAQVWNELDQPADELALPTRCRPASLSVRATASASFALSALRRRTFA
jgi:antitoxin component of RelBE/YafQ-DinJ toxin-antitoxin module